jgi:hypothetical protein
MTRLALVTTALLVASVSAFAPRPLTKPSFTQTVNRLSYHSLDYAKSLLESSTTPDDKSTATDLIGDDSAYFSLEEQVRIRGKCYPVSLCINRILHLFCCVVEFG